MEEVANPDASQEGHLTQAENSGKGGLNIPSRISHDGAMTGVSLSWMHSIQDMPVEGQAGLLQRTNDHHISSSLPAYFSEVLGAHMGSSKLTTSSVSESLLHATRNIDLPFKSFPNLMPPHEIYKLVEVTPVSENSSKRESGKVQHEKSPSTQRQSSGAMSKTDDGKEV